MRTNPLEKLKTIRCLLLFAAFLLGGLAPSVSARDTDDFPLGPIGGVFNLAPGENCLRVKSLIAAAPGAVAGLQAEDAIYGAFGEDFGVTSTDTKTGFVGAAQDLGMAIERAESGNGQLPLKVLRSGSAPLVITVNLPVVDGFGPAYPVGSTKYDAIYQWAAGRVHAKVTASSNGNFGYNSGWFGMILLSHPNWADIAGAKPYRTSINKLRDWCKSYLEGRILVPVEGSLMDGSANPAYVDSGLENWTIGSSAMFLAVYRQKTGDTSVDVVLQRAADMLANRVQDWQQPPYNGTTGPTKVGLMGHGGVVGDYPHIGWSGINIINAHAVSALALLKGAGAQVNDDKFQKAWKWMRSCMSTSSGFDGGNVGYAWQQNGYDSSARTTGAIFAFANYGGIAGEEANVQKMEDYAIRAWMRLQHSHAYTVGGQAFYQLALPYLDDRGQRYILDNWRLFYNLSRQPDGSMAYMGGRDNNGGDGDGGYLGIENSTIINVGMAGAIGSRNLPPWPALDPSRIYLRINSPWTTWPTLAAKRMKLSTLSATVSGDITDYQGATLAPATYNATWSQVSGPAQAVFTNSSVVSTQVNFPVPGTYRLQLVVTKGGYTLTEPFDCEVSTSGPPAGYTMGEVNYEVYTSVSGTAVANLTSAAKYPNNPDVTGTLTSLESTYRGDNYGQRIRGFIVPPTTGSYTFSIASDDTSQLKFNSAGPAEAGATVVCSVTSWTNQNEWAKLAGQSSASVNLTAGQPYFFEVLHKEGTGGDHVAVAWTGPGISTPTVVPGSALALVTPITAITQQPQSLTVAAGDPASFHVGVSGAGPFIYQWSRDGVAEWGTSNAPDLDLANVGAGAAGTYKCVITSPAGTMTTNEVTLTVTGVGGITQGGLWREVYNGISGGAVSSLINDDDFPRYPNSGGVITSAEAPADYGDDYGQRWTGWLCPTVSASYKFYLTADDSAELWLSTDSHPLHKVKVASLASYTGVRSWSSGGKSALIPLQAGKRYYIEILHKEGGGGDHCAVAWQKSTDPVPANGSAPIAGQYLQCITGGIFSDYAAPLAVDDVGQYGGSPAVVNVLANDFDANDGLVVTAVTNGVAGTVTTNGTTVTYTPGNTFFGSDHFTYTMRNASGATSSAAVTVRSTIPMTQLSFIGATAGKKPKLGDEVPGEENVSFKTFGIPAINAEGAVAFLTTVNTGAASVPAIFDGTSIVAQKGDPVAGPNGVVFAKFKDPAINGNGEVAFLATLANAPGAKGGVTSANNLALITNLGGSLVIAARKNIEIAGIPGAKLSSITAFQLLDDGVLFSGKIASKTLGGFALCLWTPAYGMKILLREGSDLNGRVVKKIFTLLPSAVSTGHGRKGSTGSNSGLARVAFTDGKQAIVQVDSNGAALLAMTGETAPADTQWGTLGLPVDNENGNVAFLGSLLVGPGEVTKLNNDAIFTGNAAGGFAMAIREDQTIEGLKLKSMTDPVLNEEGDLLFQATLTGTGVTTASSKALVSVPKGGTPKIIARLGTGCESVANTKWKAFKSIALPDGLGPVFTALITAGGVKAANDMGLWAQDGSGTLRLLLREGDPLDVDDGEKKVKTFAVLGLVSGSPGQTRAFNREHQIAVRVTFLDGSQAIVKIAVP